ncbi:MULTISPECIES: FAD-dependent oxidoreductase [unclassified Streptomyces]|uniref:FAD-dependent oxidoreductase n=1 Tax=unclassified Streptomyces TaxID=2593676 RepID=UPI00093C81DE|nr:FAD-binding monooxygenase [Streptomyces sp. CB02414]OKI84071.1 FAD-binding monooxygenase [Streptomyces sp. CB02414]
MGKKPRRALVLGGSYAGLFAARVLTEQYDEVLIVDRDRLVGERGPRRGRPQGRHINAMHVRGLQVTEELFPGFIDGLVADGCPTGDYAGSCRWYFNGLPLVREDIGYIAVPATAPLMERHLRERVEQLPGVRFVERHDIVGLEATPDHSRITGARLSDLDDDRREVVIEADLVVDATGRGSRTPAMLKRFGYGTVPEERIKIDLGYVTQHYELDDDPWRGDLAIIPVAYPGSPRGAIFTQTDHGRVELTTYGLLGDHPPTDQEGFYEFVRSLAVPDIADALETARPVDEPVPFHYPVTLRRRYERMSRLPAGLVVTGDAVTSFNPVYAQGMTVAAVSALTLRRHLRPAGGPDPAAYFRDLARDCIDAPWEMTTTVDLNFPDVPGHRSLKMRMVQRYLRLVQVAATRDPKVTTAYLRAAGMVDTPQSLMRPGVLWRVLRGAFTRSSAAARPRQPALARTR